MRKDIESLQTNVEAMNKASTTISYFKPSNHHKCKLAPLRPKKISKDHMEGNFDPVYNLLWGLLESSICFPKRPFDSTFTKVMSLELHIDVKNLIAKEPNFISLRF